MLSQQFQGENILLFATIRRVQQQHHPVHIHVHSFLVILEEGTNKKYFPQVLMYQSFVHGWSWLHKPTINSTV